MANNIERMIADTFMEMAQGLETGSFGKRPKVALTGMGSEHGEENSMKADVEAAKDGIAWRRELHEGGRRGGKRRD